MKISSRTRFAGVALLIAGYYLALVWPGFSVYFSSDDLMNLYTPWTLRTRALILANLIFFRSSPIYRPLGSAWYAVVFHFAGFHPFPFHAAYAAIFLINMWWTYAISRRLSGSREIAAVAALLISYSHPMSSLFLDNAFVYDALCYCFYFVAVLLYVRMRQQHKQLTSRQLTALCLLYLCALNSKEMAVTLPVTLLIYELTYHTPGCWSEAARILRSPAIILTGLITIIFAIGRSLGPESLLTIPAYRPAFTVAQFLASSRNFFNDVFMDATNTRVLALWALLFAIAWLSHSRVLRFAWLFLMLAPLPVAFILPRGPAQYYIPWFGWVLFASVVLVRLVDRLTRGRGAILLPALAIILFAHYRREGWDNATSVSLEAPVIRDTAEQLHSLYPRLPSGSRLFFKNDPFPPDHWELTFLVKESYRDDSLQVFRIKQQDHPADPAAKYDYIFDYRAGRFFEQTAAEAGNR